MKRKILITVVFVLAFLMATFSTAFAADEQYSIVRVKLSIGDPTEFSFFADGNYTIGADGPGLERQQYTVKLEGGALNLYCGGDRVASGASIKLVRHTETSGRNNFIWMYNTQAGSGTSKNFKYIGDMEFIIESGHIAAVNHVYIEDYLYGVVPNEMYESFPAEALKAQAVAARSYVEYHLRSSKPYDVVDTTDSQVYYGYNPSNTNSINAVNATSKNVLKDGSGNIIETLFSASNGGWTDIPLHRWNSADVPYFQITQDDFDAKNPDSYFETIFLPATIDEAHPITASDNIKDSDPNPGNAQAFIKQIIFNSGQIQAAGQPVATRDDFSLIGVTSLVMADGNFDTDNGQDHSRAGGGGVCADRYVAKGSFTVFVPSTGATVPISEIDLDLRYLDASNGVQDYKSFFKSNLSLFVVEQVKDGETITGYSISQKRFGHGIGLSQRGAQQRANSTDPNYNTYDKILGFYYPGTTLAPLPYGEAPTLSPASVPDHSNAKVINEKDTTPLNVRSGAGTGASKIGSMPIDARMEIVQLNSATANGYTWHKIFFGGQYGYVAANYVQPDSNPPAREALAVGFDSTGGSPVSVPQYYHADSIDAAPSSSRPGFVLDGWYLDTGLTAKAAFPYLLTRGTTFYAKWIPTECTVNFDAAGGSGVGSVRIGYQDVIGSEPTTTRNGFNFAGWFTPSGERVSFPYTVRDNVTLTARWNAQPQTNMLSGVRLSCGSLNRGFAKTVTSYKITLGENDANFTLTPVKDFDNASMTINGRAASSYSVSLANGKSATITVKVTFAKKAKTYKFTVTRAKSSNNLLSSLSIAGGSLNQGFNPNVQNYTLTLDENTKSTTIKAVAAAGKAASVSPASTKVALNNGQSKAVKITVKAQSGAKRTYTINVVRAASTNTNLKSLKASGLSPKFSPGNTNYTIVLPANKNAASISAAAAGFKAVVKIDGAKKSSKKVTLANGQSVVVRVTVISQAGNSKDYLITVVRQ